MSPQFSFPMKKSKSSSLPNMVKGFLTRLLRPFNRFHTLWFLMNGLLFWNTYRLYKGQPQYHYLHQMLGSGLCISRGSGAVLNVNCGLILLPTCKQATTTLRQCFCSISSGSSCLRILRSLFNHAELFHVTCAITIIVAAVVHTGAHLINAVNSSLHYNYQWTAINIADSPGQSPFRLVFTTVPGVTGVLMMAILVMMVVTSGRWFRTRHFNAFYYSHHFLFGPFLILLVFHPTSGMLKEQANWHDHWNSDDESRPAPIFVPMRTYTWMWVTIPLTLYLVDWSWRKLSRRQPVSVNRFVIHQPNVMELVIDRWLPNSHPGQYVFLQSPKISTFQWHPFSLSSSCDLTHASWTVHLNTDGDWCNQLKQLFKMEGEVELFVDGPFGSPLIDVLNSRTVICIAGGIGFTPFLAAIHHLIRNGWNSWPDRLHIVWCVKTTQNLLWASAAIDQLIEDAWASPRPDKLEIQLHVTRSASSSTRTNKVAPVEKILEEKYPNLLRRLKYGRPSWPDIFSRWKEIYSTQRVDVFSCGPRQLNRQVGQMCRSISNFTLARESFS